LDALKHQRGLSIVELKSRSSGKAIGALIASVVAAILYRMGGSGNWPRQARLVGVPLVCVIFLGLFHVNWTLLICIPLMIAAISTYWKKKGTDAGFWNYYLHGLGISLAMFPYAIATGKWLGFALRSLSLPFLIALWATYMNRPLFGLRSDVVSECGRGALIGATLPLLLL
jgi:hypothetical protein